MPILQERRRGSRTYLDPLLPDWGLWTDILLVAGVSWTSPFLVKDLICSWGQFPVWKTPKACGRQSLLGFCGPSERKETKFSLKIFLSLIVD